MTNVHQSRVHKTPGKKSHVDSDNWSALLFALNFGCFGPRGQIVPGCYDDIWNLEYLWFATQETPHPTAQSGYGCLQGPRATNKSVIHYRTERRRKSLSRRSHGTTLATRGTISPELSVEQNLPPEKTVGILSFCERL